MTIDVQPVSVFRTGAVVAAAFHCDVKSKRQRRIEVARLFLCVLSPQR